MDNWQGLADEKQVKACADIVKKLTSPSVFEAFRYMPPTLNFLPSQLSLLFRFLNDDGTEGS